jgi:catechol 2,3-dioxygenase-like lactoylglutathione lyase family enzyme
MDFFNNEFRVIFYVSDYEANNRFYGEGLELSSNYCWDYGPDDRGIKYLVGGGVIEIVCRQAPLEQGAGTIMIEAKNVDECYDAICMKPWMKIIEPLADRSYGVRVFRLLDPNGNDVVVFSYISNK